MSIFSVFVAPPKDFGPARKDYGGTGERRVAGDSAFYRDQVRDRQLFGLTGSASTHRKTFSEEKRSKKKTYDKLITRDERKDRYNNVKPLDSFNKPKYSNIERSSKYKSKQNNFPNVNIINEIKDTSRVNHNEKYKYLKKYSDNKRSSQYQSIQDNFPKAEKFIDASRFDYDIANYDYIEDEVENSLSDFEYNEEDEVKRAFKLKRRNLDEKLSSLGLNTAERRNIRIHIPSQSSSQFTTKRPQKKIIIRRFKKTSPLASRMSSKREKRHKKTQLTPAEKYYLEMKSKLTTPSRVSKLTARSISDSLEGESYQSLHGHHLKGDPSLHNHHLKGDPSLHGHHLEGAVVRGVSGFSPERFEEPKKIQFQIHGQGGPHSYRFGHDTGIG